ncbi:hypothetical protein HPP92_018390 [Vanilla planifolia]|uniref:CDP-diacylglycerol--glycerol-3-phosphate 3-phosphatidyltransferase n=1 Tax=Vanilla planifolia TaxID=51239 RepID=A0A835QJX2_VANPL|nr:hypothetical protein HPP92_018390 [Vanilla planifolia]
MPPLISAAVLGMRTISVPFLSCPSVIYVLKDSYLPHNRSALRAAIVGVRGAELNLAATAFAMKGCRAGESAFPRSPGESRREIYTANHQNGSTEAESGMSGGTRRSLLEQQKDPSRLLTLPTVLTLGRVAAVPLLVSTYYMNGSWATTTTTSIFLVAAITDWLDGYLARKMRLGTTFGAFLDPVADKLMVAAALVLLCTKPVEVAVIGQASWLLTVPAIAIVGREITMSAVREWAASKNSKVLEAVAVNNLGKWKTATQMIALTVLLVTRDPRLTGPGFLVSTGVFLLYVSAGLALWSLAVYLRKIWRVMIK